MKPKLVYIHTRNMWTVICTLPTIWQNILSGNKLILFGQLFG